MKRLLPIVMSLPMLLTLVQAQGKDLSPALSSLLAAERAFARTSVEKGIRDSFLEFFADDGINFQPHPTKTKEAILRRPVPSARPPVVLDWQPAYADVSRAGDLGYTTGPYTLTDHSPDPSPTRYGVYFSIWKKQTDGSWKVVVDAGIQTPDRLGHDFTFTPAPSSAYRNAPKKISQDTLRSLLVSLDRDFLLATSSRGIALAYLDYLDVNSRLHRNGSFPVVGRDAIRLFLRSQAIELKCEPITSDVSQSGDLGYTYGSYELKHTAMNEVIPPEKGYYVRVWKRDAKGKWKLVLDTLSPIPEKGK